MSRPATDVGRRGTDGRWRYVIDNPFGVAQLPEQAFHPPQANLLTNPRGGAGQ
ncbi:hypothetical protein GCM10027290_23430 [Micromonospora sonneratiae]